MVYLKVLGLQNKEVAAFDFWEAEIDDTLIGPSYGMRVKKNGTWVLDLSQTGAV